MRQASLTIQHRLGMRSCLTNAASSARSRFGVCLELGNLHEEVKVVDTWLTLLRRPILVHSVEANAFHLGTWLDPLVSVEDLEASRLMTVRSAAVTQQLLSVIPAVVKAQG